MIHFPNGPAGTTSNERGLTQGMPSGLCEVRHQNCREWHDVYFLLELDLAVEQGGCTSTCRLYSRKRGHRHSHQIESARQRLLAPIGYAIFSVELEIERNKAEVGPPISALKITNKGARWVPGEGCTMGSWLSGNLSAHHAFRSIPSQEQEEVVALPAAQSKSTSLPSSHGPHTSHDTVELLR